jgi:hypothetical protein
VTRASSSRSGTETVMHPTWCTSDRCTATAAATVGEAHASHHVVIPSDLLAALRSESVDR